MRLTLFVLALAATAHAQILVDSTADVAADDGVCTLREAITAANTDLVSGVQAGECEHGNGPDVIRLDLPPGSVIALTDDLPAVVEALAIEGGLVPGDVTIDGGGEHRALYFSDYSGDGQSWTLRRLTVTGGRTTLGGGAHFQGPNTCLLEDVVIAGNASTSGAGGVFVGSLMTCVADRVWVADNETDGSGGGFYASRGSTVTLRNSTVSGNAAGQGAGGVLAFFNTDSAGPGTFVLEQSTVSGNTSGGGTGGVDFRGPAGTFQVRASAIVDNVTTANNSSAAGLTISAGDGTITSSVIAGNRARVADGADLSVGADVVSGGGNIIGIGQGGGFAAGEPNENGDLIGDRFSPFDPGLAPLGSYGSGYPVHLPLGGSQVLDFGRCLGFETDQRGRPREMDYPSRPNVGGDACDVGPVEGTINAVTTEGPEARALRLDAPVPNPARGLVRLLYETSAVGPLSLTVVDVLGRTVAVLAEGHHQPGTHRAEVDVAALAPGAYWLRLSDADQTAVQQLVVIR